MKNFSSSYLGVSVLHNFQRGIGLDHSPNWSNVVLDHGLGRFPCPLWSTL
jgi:hypothetical protein